MTTATPDAAQRDHLSGLPAAGLLQAILERTGIHHNWDLLVLGDGSGSGWDRACGWASVLIDRNTQGRRAFYGAMNLGSINFAESMPYLHALNWYDAHFGKDRLKQQKYITVHIITDSQVVASWGNHAMGQLAIPSPRKHLPLWAAMRAYAEVGYRCTFHWSPRMTSQLNWLADAIAGLSRHGLEDCGQPAHDLRARAIAGLEQTCFYVPGTTTPLDPYLFDPAVE